MGVADPKSIATPLSLYLLWSQTLELSNEVLYDTVPQMAAELQAVKVWTIRFFTIYYTNMNFFQTVNFDGL